MKNVLIAPVGDNMDQLFFGLKEFPAERVILVSQHKDNDLANKTKEDLEKFKIASKIIYIEGNIWEESFRIVSETKELYKDQEIVINVITGNEDIRCAMTSAAFVNGIRAFTVQNDEVLMLPILKFSYYKILTDRKMQILKLLFEAEKSELNLETISKETKMSLPLISYHINGNLKSEGLKELGLVTSREEKGRSFIKLSNLGKLLVKGYFNQ